VIPIPSPGPETLAAYAHCEELVRRSGSSFAAAFWMFPRAKRRALHAIYAFCRLADDIADDPDVAGDRGLLLDRWRKELRAAYRGKAQHPVGVALMDAVRRFDLPEPVFEDLLEGVASTVGLLIVQVLGYHNPRSLDYAVTLGIAVQLTNVLRDVGEDAVAGRVYLPREDLERLGVDPASLALSEAGEERRLLMALYAERARIFYERAEALLPEEDRHGLRPAEAMGRIYRTLLGELQRRGYPCSGETVRLSSPRRLAIAATAWLGVGGGA
jgi:phytoene synthase